MARYSIQHKEPANLLPIIYLVLNLSMLKGIKDKTNLSIMKYETRYCKSFILTTLHTTPTKNTVVSVQTDKVK